MIKNIIFDLGGVLIDLDMNGMQKACVELGVSPEVFFVPSTEVETSTVCNGYSASRVISDYQVGKIPTPDFVQLVLSLCQQGVSEQQLIDAWNSCLGTIPASRIELIRSLRAMGYGICLLSNTNDLHWRYVEERYLSEKGLFDHIFLSHEMHLAKPDAEIYRQCIKQIGCKAEECLFIDDAKENIEAACREGINGEWLDLTKEDAVSLIRRVLKK